MNVISDGKGNQYNPPLPTSLVKEELDSKNYGTKERKNPLKQMVTTTGNKGYDPPLPNSLVKETDVNAGGNNCNYDVNKNTYGGGQEGRIKISKDKKDHVAKYDQPLPNSLVKEKDEN